MRPDHRLLQIACLAAVLLAHVFTTSAAEEVVVLSPHAEAIRSEFGQGFREWHNRRFGRPASVNWRQVGGTSDALRYVQSEFSRKTTGIGIDCFFGGGQEPFLFLKEKKLCQAYQPPEEILRGIPPTVQGIELYDPQFEWFGAALSSFGILQNTRVQKMAGLKPVRKWSELSDPALFGTVGAGDPRNSGTMNVMFEALLQSYGWEKGWQVIFGLAGNTRKFDRISSSTAKDVSLGETVYGMAVDFYAFPQIAMAGKSNLSFVLPDDCAALNPDCIALLRGGPNPIVAQRFIQFVLSEEGQQLWFLPKGHPNGPKKHSIERMSIRPELYRKYAGISNIEISPFEMEKLFRYDSARAKTRRETLPALIGAILIDPHPELQKAWRSAIRLGLNEERLMELAAPPVSEAELVRLGREKWSDPVFRNQTRMNWQRWAQEKYHRLSQKAAPADSPR